jgi:holo-[acyl-carrier protein] synthase
VDEDTDILTEARELRVALGSLQVGVDIVEIPRVEASLRRFGDRFRHRVYTARELAETGERGSSLAARFAAKEAVIKALGSADIALHEIEVVRPIGCRPEVRLRGRAAARAAALGVQELSLSLSHSQDYAVAMVVLRQSLPDDDS